MYKNFQATLWKITKCQQLKCTKKDIQKKFFCTKCTNFQKIEKKLKKPIAIFRKRVYNSIVVKRQAQNKKFEKNKKIFKKPIDKSIKM